MGRSGRISLKNKKNVLLIFVVFIFLAGAYWIFRVLNPSGQRSNEIAYLDRQYSRLFQSASLDFTVSVPDFYSVEEKLTIVRFEANGGQIDVIRNATDFDTLDEYLLNSDSQKNLEVSYVNSLSVNGYPVKNRIELNRDSKTTQKVYYIYVDNWVYIISTKFEALFSDIDQIAQSFRYVP
jgi:hypothetical protein